MDTKIKKESNDFTIRIRFRIPSNKLGIDESEITVGVTSKGKEIKLKSADKKSPIKEADWLILVSDGWETLEIAESNSIKLMDSLCRALSFHNLSADLGRRTPGGGFFRPYLDKLEKDSGRKILNDERGIMIFETALNPLVAHVGEMSGYKSVPKDKWSATFQRAIDLSESFSDRESMAFDLFTMAHKVQQSADARFVLLFAAIETLLEPTDRPKNITDHVDDLISQTEKANLPKDEMVSLVGSLRWLRSHSIRASGRKFVSSRLGERKYGIFTAEKLFMECYVLRNRLLHGQKPYAEWREITNIVAPLEQMVSHLLSGCLQTN